MTIVTNDDPLDAADVVCLYLNLNLASFGVERVPDHLRHCPGGSVRFASRRTHPAPDSGETNSEC